MFYRFYLWCAAGCMTLAMTMGCASPPPSEPPPTRFDFPDSLPRSVGVLTFLGDRLINDRITDEFAIGLALLRFYPVHRIEYQHEKEDQARMVAISEDMVQSMWYRALTDSIARMEAPVDIEGLFVGSFSSVAEALDEDQEKILPTGILNIRLYDMKTRQVVWRTTLRDREIFPATMDLNASIPPLVSQAIEALKEQYELYPKVIDGL